MGAGFDHEDTKNQRPIYYGIYHNRFEMVKFLIDKGADLKMKDKKGATPTQYAQKMKKLEILNLLLENGGEPISDRNRGNANAKCRPKQ